LRAMEGGGGDSGARKWAWSGKWAVVSFSPGRWFEHADVYICRERK
jgi:hypothetical protein